MLPTVAPDLSLVNSLLELKDFKSIGKSFKSAGTLTSLPGLASTLRDTIKLIAKDGKLKTRSLADLYLQYKFNLRPLISDIENIVSSLSRLERRINDLMSRQGRRQNAHFTRVIDESSINYAHTEANPTGFAFPADRHGWYCSHVPLSGMAKSERFVYVEPSVFHAQLQYSYYYADYQTEHARLLSILDAWGVNFNPAIVWNAIPWSFVIDWVLSVSRFLDQFRYGFMDPAVCIHRALWSITRRRRILVQTKVWAPTDYGAVTTPQTIVHPQTSETAYRRGHWNVMDVQASLKASGISFTEASLAAALAITRKPHPRVRGRKSSRRT